MTKNAAKIKAGIKALTHKPYEIVSGTVVPGSIDMEQYTISVQPSDGSDPIESVMLNAISADGNGMILYPIDGSSVIIGTIDGPGEWTILKACDLVKIVVMIGANVIEMDTNQIVFTQGSAMLTMTGGKFSMKNGSTDLNTLLGNILSHILAMTVSTGTGPSGTAINTPDFLSDQSSLGELLF